MKLLEVLVGLKRETWVGVQMYFSCLVKNIDVRIGQNRVLKLVHVALFKWCTLYWCVVPEQLTTITIFF